MFAEVHKLNRAKKRLPAEEILHTPSKEIMVRPLLALCVLQKIAYRNAPESDQE